MKLNLKMDQRKLFEHRLALKLGMTVYQMRESMTSEEFMDWMEYDRYEPLHSTDIQLAQLSMMAASFMGAKGAKFIDYYVHQPGDTELQSTQTTQEITKDKKTNENREIGYELDNYIQNAYR